MTAETFNAAIPGTGCTVAYCTTSGGTYTPVGQLQSIDGLDMSVATWESTGLTSPGKEKIATLFDAGDFGFKVVFNPADATHYALAGYMVAKTLLYWQLTFASPTGPGATAPGSPILYAWAAYLTGYNITGFEAESGVTAAIKTSITGLVTFAS